LDIDAVGYCERVLAFLIDLEAQLTTRLDEIAILLDYICIVTGKSNFNYI
jgi:hypothetical protein